MEKKSIKYNINDLTEVDPTEVAFFVDDIKFVAQTIGEVCFTQY